MTSFSVHMATEWTVFILQTKLLSLNIWNQMAYSLQFVSCNTSCMPIHDTADWKNL